jgi:CTP synthase
VNYNSVIQAIDAETIYDVPLMMLKEKLDERVLSKLRLSTKGEVQIESWKEFLGRHKNPTDEVEIGLVGKYVELLDAYKSISESFVHAGAKNECKVRLRYISSDTISAENVCKTMENLHGILVAPGFGERGMRGKIEAARFAREQQIPYFGICLGMQCAVIEFARNVLGLEDAASSEMEVDSKHFVIDLMENQKRIINKGGTMRLGAYDCTLKKGTKIHHAYGKIKLSERHRHRYEFNNKYMARFEKAGMVMSGINPKTKLVETIELSEHPWFIGTQYHPELKSTVLNPHKLFVEFVKAALEHKGTQ